LPPGRAPLAACASIMRTTLAILLIFFHKEFVVALFFSPNVLAVAD
jgi:hypothetical protein